MTDQATRDALYWRSVADRYEAEINALRVEARRLREAVRRIVYQHDCDAGKDPETADRCWVCDQLWVALAETARRQEPGEER